MLRQWLELEGYVGWLCSEILVPSQKDSLVFLVGLSITWFKSRTTWFKTQISTSGSPSPTLTDRPIAASLHPSRCFRGFICQIWPYKQLACLMLAVICHLFHSGPWEGAVAWDSKSTTLWQSREEPPPPSSILMPYIEIVRAKNLNYTNTWSWS